MLFQGSGMLAASDREGEGARLCLHGVQVGQQAVQAVSARACTPVPAARRVL